jgi:hypothetical protein
MSVNTFSGPRFRLLPARRPRPRRFVAGFDEMRPSASASDRIRCSVLRHVLMLEMA